MEDHEVNPVVRSPDINIKHTKYKIPTLNQYWLGLKLGSIKRVMKSNLQMIMNSG